MGQKENTYEIININPGKRVTTKNVQGLDYLVKGEILIVD